MAFRNFMYAEDDEDLSFLQRDPSPSFGISSPFTLIKNEPSLLEAEPLYATNSDSVAWRMKDKKVRMKGFTKPLIKRKLVPPQGLNARGPLLQKLSLPYFSLYLMVKKADVELLNLHDRCYASPSIMDNPVNQRAHVLLKVADQLMRECDMLKEREKAKEKEYEELKAKCEAVIADFDNNLTVNVLREKIKSLFGEENLATLELKVATLEAKKGRLEAVKATFHQEINPVKCDRSKRCAAFEEVANMKEPFDLEKVKGYRPSYKKEHTKGGNDLVTATFPFLSEVVADPSRSVKPYSPRSHSLFAIQLRQRPMLMLHQLLLRKPSHYLKASLIRATSLYSLPVLSALSCAMDSSCSKISLGSSLSYPDTLMDNNNLAS
nr:hypothetical protein [Tanacetum cinerariifolium]